jgi:hypothetical protein
MRSIDENHKNAGTMIVIGGLARPSYKLRSCLVSSGKFSHVTSDV